METCSQINLVILQASYQRLVVSFHDCRLSLYVVFELGTGQAQRQV